MLSIKILAGLLLTGHVGSVTFISLVVKRQLRLLKLPIDKELQHFRYTLVSLSFGILLGNVVPILIDGLTLFFDLGRPTHVKPISIAYAVSNALVELTSAYLIWKLYRLAAGTKVITDYEHEQLHQNT